MFLVDLFLGSAFVLRESTVSLKTCDRVHVGTRITALRDIIVLGEIQRQFS